MDISNRKYGKNNLLSRYFGFREPQLLSRFTVIEKEAFRTQLFEHLAKGDMKAFLAELDTIAADFNAGELVDEKGNTLLMRAVAEKKMPFIRLLLNETRLKFDWKAANKDGQTVHDLVPDMMVENLLRDAELAKDTE
jgi:hypothetical protein